ncbi:hypothetical protein D9M68_937010 [compost metagenome]
MQGVASGRCLGLLTMGACEQQALVEVSLGPISHDARRKHRVQPSEVGPADGSGLGRREKGIGGCSDGRLKGIGQRVADGARGHGDVVAGHGLEDADV